MKRLLILSGPQGSGNHMWSKIFALHSKVFGWQALLDEYWIGHDREPFAECWRNPQRLPEFDWSHKDFYVTSISVPYIDNGVTTVPDICQFINVCENIGIKADVVILGRDQNILDHQEQRLRGQRTYEQARQLYETLRPRCYLSYELLQLYQRQYLLALSHLLDFPIASDHPMINTIIGEDANKKYLCPAEAHWVDELARKTSSKWR